MGTIQFHVVSLLLCSVLCCCPIDTNRAGDGMVSPIVGTWDPVVLNINPPQDIDGDGNTTTNILNWTVSPAHS